MNDLISWDSSLVKKFSSSNHFKLLNQLRNEVKKYPLNNKKKIRSIDNNESNIDSKNNTNTSRLQETIASRNLNQSKDSYSNSSTVSFNNSKNFSIYNSNETTSLKNEYNSVDHYRSTDTFSSTTFTDRLNKVELK
tara:strand:+ start:168 stop:575 length:408 start_codon:yes stop_codon:yes gene_type:complete